MCVCVRACACESVTERLSRIERVRYFTVTLRSPGAYWWDGAQHGSEAKREEVKSGRSYSGACFLTRTVGVFGCLDSTLLM